MGEECERRQELRLLTAPATLPWPGHLCHPDRPHPTPPRLPHRLHEHTGTGQPPASPQDTDTGGGSSASPATRSPDVAAVAVPVLFLVLLSLGAGFAVLYTKHRRLQSSFSAFASSHYSSRLGSAIFSSGDDLGDDDEDAPMITGFSDDVPMVIA
ncbi:sortilin-related receptor-like [Erinaceus europaeus]|uniref:Sortilin-related receptor-like n=1 Tax=Erinaceus europaeus TaxID=9365 RepID=A0ABM3WGP2_ERIEU|nr:sortilin-related receptor-like [Erinaceus europaeus]